MSWPSPPSDYGSDRFDYVEIDAPTGTPPPDWLTDEYMPCQDCRANLFLRWTGTGWDVTIAHDATCSTLRALEANG